MKLEIYPTPELLARIDRWRSGSALAAGTATLSRAAAARALITMALDAAQASETTPK